MNDLIASGTGIVENLASSAKKSCQLDDNDNDKHIYVAPVYRATEALWNLLEYKTVFKPIFSITFILADTFHQSINQSFYLLNRHINQ